MAQLDFNAHEVEPTQEYTPLPNGQYVAVISESDVKPTKKGDGRLLELVLVVIEGEYANRKIWTRLNIVNRNAIAQNIAKAHLSSICRAIGVMKTNDSSELHNIPIRVTVVCKPRGDGNSLTNEVTHFAAVNAVADSAASVTPTAAPMPAASPTPATPASVVNTPPWNRPVERSGVGLADVNMAI